MAMDLWNELLQARALQRELTAKLLAEIFEFVKQNPGCTARQVGEGVGMPLKNAERFLFTLTNQYGPKPPKLIVDNRGFTSFNAYMVINDEELEKWKEHRREMDKYEVRPIY
jgi:hypothetical protein